MSLSPIEKSCFKFLSQFYFYLWPYDLAWDKSYTFVRDPKLGVVDKICYYFWLTSMVSYSVGGLFVVFYNNSIQRGQNIATMDAVILMSIVVALILSWFVTKVSVQIIEGFNKLLLLCTRLNSGMSNRLFFIVAGLQLIILLGIFYRNPGSHNGQSEYKNRFKIFYSTHFSN